MSIFTPGNNPASPLASSSSSSSSASATSATGGGAAGGGGSSADTSLPVHEYWLEHKRAMTLELEAQRSTMLFEIANSQRSALLGIELVRSKLEEDIEAFYKEFRHVLGAVQEALEDGWKKIQDREKSLFTLQTQMNDTLGTNLKAAKEHIMRNAELESSYDERKEQLEEWAEHCQNLILKREEELGATARKLDADMSAIMIARKRLATYDREVSMRQGTVAKIVYPSSNSNSDSKMLLLARKKNQQREETESEDSNRNTGPFGAATRVTSSSGSGSAGAASDEVMQVPTGEAFNLHFQLEMNPIPENVIDRKNYPKVKDFENVPVTLSYMEGKNGKLWGTVQTLVGENGMIELNGVRLQGTGGSTHILLVSIPKTVSGSVHPMEVRVHLYTVPKIDVVGAWKPDVRSLAGRIRIRHAEPFSVANAKMALSLVIQRDAISKTSKGGSTRVSTAVAGSAGDRSESSSTAASASSSAIAFGKDSRAIHAECEGDAQNDFNFNIPLPTHVWEELESSLLVLEFITPNLVVFPALHHRFDLDWMHVSLGGGNSGGGARYAKVPMFRHPYEDGAEPLNFSSSTCNFFPKKGGDLITDFAISEQGNLLLTSEVSGKLALYRYEFPQRWVLTRQFLLPSEDSHPSGLAFSKSNNLFAVHDSKNKNILVWKIAKVLKNTSSASSSSTSAASAAAGGGGGSEGSSSSSSSVGEELDEPDFVIDYTQTMNKHQKEQAASGIDGYVASFIKPIEDVIGPSLLVHTPNLGLHLFPSDTKKRPVLLVDPKGQNSVRVLYHKVLPQVGSVAMVGYDNGEVVVTATSSTKATGKRVQYKFTVVKGSPIACIAEGNSPDSFLCCTICTVCIIKTQPTWSVMRCSYVTSAPIAAVSIGTLPNGVRIDEEEKDGIACVCHSNGFLAAIGIVTGSILGTSMLPDVGENQAVPAVSNAALADAGALGARIVASSSLKPAAWESKLVSVTGDDQSGVAVPVQFSKQQEEERQQKQEVSAPN